MKKCKMCNSIVNDGDKFCTNCGNSEFYDEYNEETELLTEQDQPKQFIYYSEGINPEGVGREVHKIPAKKNSGKIVGIVFIVLLLLTAIGLTLNILSKKHISKPSTTEDPVQYEEIIPFTKGGVVDGVYKNQWVGIQFALGDNWIEAPQSGYGSYEDENTICGFYAINKENVTLNILFIKLSEQNIGTIYDEEEYLSEYIKGVSTNMTSSESTDIMYQLVGSQLYKYADITGVANNKSVSISAYLRQIDNYIVLINITSQDVDTNHSVLEEIEVFAD